MKLWAKIANDSTKILVLGLGIGLVYYPPPAMPDAADLGLVCIVLAVFSIYLD